LGAPAATAPVAAPAGPTFATAVHPVLMSVCAACHRAGGPAGMTRFLLSGDAARDDAVVRALVDPRAPESSILLTKASGQMHAGGAPLPAGDPRRAAIVAWIARLAAPPPAAAPAAVAPGAPAPESSVPAAPAPPAPPPPSAGPPAGLGLPLGFMLNGRFDLNYERRQFTGNPFDSASVAALRSYHHFLFLSRDAGDPCGLTVEMLTLLFWEGHCRLPWRPGPVSVSVAAGKIVVPFGSDPLFHQSYGGLAGFDQVVLPPVWSIEGVAAHAVYWRGPLAVTDDLYVVRGYTLQQADSVINLQSGFSPDDDTKLAIGNRLGAAWMGISAWYSAYFNPLGFGRHLFMQAIDVNIWRQRQIPVLGHFSLGFGLLRADVSGGGPGVGGVGYDYYDFADYLQLRYYPVDWLFLQYRTGLFTFDNMRGLVVDNSRLTSADGSTHNFGIVARTRNLWFGIFYFINLEKVNEIPNDILRFNVTYEF
jgi:mono/diheme cytochrome c family protein